MFTNVSSLKPKTKNMRTFLLCSTFLLIVASAWAGNDPAKRTYFTGNQVSLAPTGDKDMNEGGFFLNIGLMVPSKNCYVPAGFTNNSKEKFNIGPSLELGNMFVITKLMSHAIGLRATWLTANYSKWSDSNVDAAYLGGSVVRLGPYFTFAIGDEVAVDYFYQVGAGYAIDLEQDTVASGNDNAGYLGLTHNTGLCFRYKLFSLGFDINFGKLKYADKDEYDGLSDDMINDFYKIRSSHFRIFAGFKF